MNFDKFADVLGNVAMKLQSNHYLNAIKNSFIAIIPFTIAGSIAVLLGSVLFGDAMLGGIAGLEFLKDLKPLFDAVNFAAMNFMAIMVSFLIGYYLAIEKKVFNPFFAGLISLASFIVLVPTTMSAGIKEMPEAIVKNVISSNYTGSKGLFVAIIVGLIVITLYAKLMGNDKLRIKLHESVPENVSNSFTSLIPTIVILFGVGIFGFAFQKITGFHFADVVYKSLQTPLEAMMQNPFGIVIAAFFGHLLWVFGIHGASLVTGILEPILLSALATNAELFQKGAEMTEIVTRPFWNMFATMGGSGNTIALLIAVLLFSKRDDEKAIAKLSLGPGAFGINEPVIFGMPIVYNPIYAIPFILSPVVGTLIGYFGIASGLVSKIYLAVPWSFPPVVNGFVSTGGDWRMALLQVFAIFVCFLIYLPFVRASNKQYEKQQLELAQQEAKEQA